MKARIIKSGRILIPLLKPIIIVYKVEKDNQNNDDLKSLHRWIEQQEQLVETMIQVEAIIRILQRTGIASMEVILEEVKKIKLELENRNGSNKWIN